MDKKEKPLNFVLIGRSGCGKGTQAKLIKEHFRNIVSISTGDMFRKLMKLDTDIGKRVRKTIEKGGLPFDDLATALWTYKIAFEIKENQGILADGLPRRLNEAKDFDKLLKYMKRDDSTYFILLDISRKEAFGRLSKRKICKKCGCLVPWVGKFKNQKVCDKCGGELIIRHDDNPEAINNRLDYYDNRVAEVVEYYRNKNNLIEIDGEQSIENVFKDILKKIK